MLISVAIPTYNREGEVGVAIRSVLSAFQFMPGQFEIVVMDDVSSDGTIDGLQRTFPAEIAAQTLRVFRNSRNLGITGNKNSGFSEARGDWVIFLDSDDALVDGAGPAMAAALRDHTGAPIIFFRCVDQNGDFVGTRFDSDRMLDLPTYLAHTSFGEVLTAVNKRVAAAPPYDAALRGYEGLGCARIISCHGPALLSSTIARIYDRSGTDRSSVGAGLMRRYPLLARGHLTMVREFGAVMAVRQKLSYLAKSVVYWILGTAYQWIVPRR